MPQMQQMQAGQMGADPALTNNLPKIIAGFLLLIPGLVTDVVAVLLLIPVVQKAMTGALMNVMMKRQQAMMEKMMGGMLSLIHISEPTRPVCSSRMPSSA